MAAEITKKNPELFFQITDFYTLYKYDHGDLVRVSKQKRKQYILFHIHLNYSPLSSPLLPIGNYEIAIPQAVDILFQFPHT